MQWFICNLQNMFSLITKVSKVDTDQNVCEVQSAISGPKCPKQQWSQFLSKENVSPGILYQEGSLRNVDSTFTFTISQVLGQDISIHSPLLRKCNISAHNLKLYQSNNCCTCQDQLIHVHHFSSSHSIDFESFGDSVLGGIFSIISFSDKTDYLLPLSGQKTKRPADFSGAFCIFINSL